MVVYVRPCEGPSRAAWVAGRKVGGAVRRNRARRLLREAWRTLAPGIGNGWELVLVARRDIDGAKAENVIQEVEELLRRERVMRR